MEINVSYPLPLNTVKCDIDLNKKEKKIKKLPLTFNLLDTLVIEDVLYVVYATNKLLRIIPVKHGEEYFVVDEQQNELTFNLENTELLVHIAVKNNLIALCYHSSIDVYQVTIATNDDADMSDDSNKNVDEKCLSLTYIRHFKNKTDAFRKVVFNTDCELLAIDNQTLHRFDINRKKAIEKVDVMSLKGIDLAVVSEREWHVLSHKTLFRLRTDEDENVTIETIARYNAVLGYFWKILPSKYTSTVAFIVARRGMLVVKTDEKRFMGNKSHLCKVRYDTEIINDMMVASETCGNFEYILISSIVKNEPTLLFVYNFKDTTFECQIKVETLSEHFYNTLLLNGKCQDFRSELNKRFCLPNAGVKIVISQKHGQKKSICILMVNSTGDITHQYVMKNCQRVLYERKFSFQEYEKWNEIISKQIRSKIEIEQIDGPNNTDLLKQILKTKFKS